MQLIEMVSDMVSEAAKVVANKESDITLDEALASNSKALKACDILIDKVVQELEVTVTDMQSSCSEAENEGKREKLFSDGICDLDDKMINLQVLAEVRQYISSRGAALE
jgi:hypothetical protein